MKRCCKKCGGSGKITYETGPCHPPIDIGNGLVMKSLGGSSTRACECVRDLPAIDGQATWWEMEEIYRKSIEVNCGEVIVSVRCEVPRMDNGRRVHRTFGNAYYPCHVNINVVNSSEIMSDEARAIAAAILEAAEVCEKADRLVTEPGKGKVKQ